MPTFFSVLVLDPRWRRWRWRAAWLIYAAILAMGSVPGARSDIGMVASGVVLHSLAYGTLAVLLYGGTTGSAGMRAIKAVAGVMAMGAGDELIQSLLPYRNGNIRDWLVDVGAAMFATAVLWGVLPRTVVSR